jgi:hypothetical protein
VIEIIGDVDDNKCKAITSMGKRCPYDAVLKGYCIKHYHLYFC